MTIKWAAMLLWFFQPENSNRWADEKYLQTSEMRWAEGRSKISAKAFVWILVSILTGLVIGRLC